MNKTYSFSEWVRICIDECRVTDGVYEFEEIDCRLKRTIDISVRGLKGIGELFQLCLPSDEDTSIEVDRSALASIGFLVDELADNVEQCLAFREIILRRESDDAAQVKAGAQ